MYSKLLTTLAILSVPVICAGQGGIITTIAGIGPASYGGDGGPATSAGIGPQGLTFDGAGNYYFVDSGARIRKVDTKGIITAFAGKNAGFGGDGGPATSAQVFPKHGIAADGAGNIYIADTYNQRIRKVDTNGIITTVAGNGSFSFSGDGGPATKAMINFPNAVAPDSAGNLFIADTSNSRVRKVTASTGVITTIAGNGNSLPNGGAAHDGSQATSVAIAQPVSITVDGAGNVYFGSFARVQKVDPSGVITTVAGSGVLGFSGDGGPAAAALLTGPTGLAIDSAGNLYISDNSNQRVRRVDPTGVITTVAGNGKTGFVGDGGPAIAAEFQFLEDVAVDAAGNFYIADSTAARIRKITAPTASNAPAVSLVANAFGEIQTIAPNMWVEIKGTGLAPAGDSRIWAGADFVNNQLPTSLDGVSVTVNGKSAFIYYISPMQVNILTPPDALSGPVQVVLTRSGVQSNATTVQTQSMALSLFVFDGKNVVATHLDGSLVGPTTLYPGASTPAKPGETIILYGNGFGLTSVPIVSGSETQSGNLAAFPSIIIGAVQANVTFAGLISPGLFQFNVVVPAAPDGSDPIVANYANLNTQPGTVLAIQR